MSNSALLRAGTTEWVHALAGGLSVLGAEGSVARSDTVPEAEVKDNNSIRKYIYYVVNIFSNSDYIAYCGIGLFPYCR